MSGWLRPRNIAIASGVAGAVFLIPRSKTQKKVAEVNPVGNVFNTPAVQSVGDRFSAGGGTQTHTPAIATPKGTSTDNTTPHEQKGVGTVHFDENHADQKPGEQSTAGKAYREAHYGQAKGK